MKTQKLWAVPGTNWRIFVSSHDANWRIYLGKQLDNFNNCEINEIRREGFHYKNVKFYRKFHGMVQWDKGVISWTPTDVAYGPSRRDRMGKEKNAYPDSRMQSSGWT